MLDGFGILGLQAGEDVKQHTCENCGEKGGHWISTRGMSLQAIITGQDDQEGFWVCQKLYDDNGKRIAA